MAANGLSMEWYTYRHRTEDEVLPWDHLNAGSPQGLPVAGLAGRAERGRGLEDCRWTPCYDCGACTGYGIEHVVASRDAAGRVAQQGTGQDLASAADEVPVSCCRVLARDPGAVRSLA